MKLYSKDKISKITYTGDYDELPTYIYSPDVEGPGPIPVAFIGKKQGKYIWINRDLEEFPVPFSKVNVQVRFTGNDSGTEVKHLLSVHTFK